MKKAIYLSTAALLLVFPGIVKAEKKSNNLTPTQVFCSHMSAVASDNAIEEIGDLVVSKSNKLSAEEKQVLNKMEQVLDDDDTVEMVCSPEQI